MRHYLQNYDKFKVLFAVVLPLVGVVTAVYLSWMQYVFPKDIALFFAFYVATGLGVTIGYHRLLTHESFKTFEPIRFLFIALGSMALMGPPDEWAAVHVEHHAHSDEEEDPHSPLEGFWHAHFGWFLKIGARPAEIEKYTPHLLTDRTVQFISKTQWLWLTLTFALPFFLGGVTGFIWAGLVRVFVVTHVTWGVNSICHCFGGRDFETTDESRNEWIIGLLAFGEGWHNNHHAFPTSAVHGLRWWQFDSSGCVIWALEKLGIIWDVKRIPHEIMEAHQERSKTMQERIFELRDQLSEAIEQAKRDLGLLSEQIPSLQEASIQEEYEKACERLIEIEHQYMRAIHLKKQKIAAYIKEVQGIGTQFSQNVALESS